MIHWFEMLSFITDIHHTTMDRIFKLNAEGGGVGLEWWDANEVMPWISHMIQHCKKKL
jgi:hypothetical protein